MLTLGKVCCLLSSFLDGGCSTVMQNVNEKISGRAQSGCHTVQFLTLAVQGIQETLSLWPFICWTLACCMKRPTSNLFLTVTAIWENYLWWILISLIGLVLRDADSLSYLHALCKKMPQDTSDFSAFAQVKSKGYASVYGSLDGWDLHSVVKKFCVGFFFCVGGGCLLFFFFFSLKGVNSYKVQCSF